jgi:ribulose-5-phosphate 4-epimerase/fuculose-1-phosphate aldolase
MARAEATAVERAGLEPFREAGRILVSLGLVRGSEGNLSTFDGTRLTITRTGRSLADLRPGDLVSGPADPAALPEASSDLEVHLRLYADRGPGALVHAHPPGTVPAGGGGPGGHGVYVFGPSLRAAVEEVVAGTREARR